MKQPKIFIIVASIFAVIGVVLLIVSYFSFQNTNTLFKDGVTAEGEVVRLNAVHSDGSTTYAPVVRFKDEAGNEVMFISNTSSSPPAYDVGENVEVLYPKSNPQKATLNSFFSLWGIVLFVGGMGMIFFLVGGGILFFIIRKKRRDQWLKHNGQPITTEFQEVVLDESTMVNGRHPFRIISQWQDPSTSTVYVFNSNPIWFDPSDYINRKHIKVLIKRNDPGKYYMDVSFLPEYKG